MRTRVLSGKMPQLLFLPLKDAKRIIVACYAHWITYDQFFNSCNKVEGKITHYLFVFIWLTQHHGNPKHLHININMLRWSFFGFRVRSLKKRVLRKWIHKFINKAVCRILESKLKAHWTSNTRCNPSPKIRESRKMGFCKANGYYMAKEINKIKLLSQKLQKKTKKKKACSQIKKNVIIYFMAA